MIWTLLVSVKNSNFKSKTVLLSIDWAPSALLETEAKNTALWLLPHCQRGFQCSDMLEWTKWNFYYKNNTVHFSCASLYIQTWEVDWSRFLSNPKATLYEWARQKGEQDLQKLPKFYIRILLYTLDGTWLACAVMPGQAFFFKPSSCLVKRSYFFLHLRVRFYFACMEEIQICILGVFLTMPGSIDQ